MGLIAEADRRLPSLIGLRCLSYLTYRRPTCTQPLACGSNLSRLL